MKLWERFLYAGALVSLIFLMFIFSTHRASGRNQIFLESKNSDDSQLFATISPNYWKKNNKENLEKSNKEIESSDVALQDAMQIIDGYYQNQSKDKSLVEEEGRLLDELQKQTNLSNTKSQTDSEEKEKFKLVKHTVEKGESLWSIAQRYKVDFSTVQLANPKLKDKMIYVGETVVVPNYNGLLYKVKNGNTLSQIAKLYKTKVNKIKEYNVLSGNEIYIGQELFLPDATPLPIVSYRNIKMFMMPLRGRITSPYGLRMHPILKVKKFHYGVDIAASMGTPIKAAASGVVIFSGDGGTYGNMVMIKHKYNYITIYAHCSKLYKKKGQYVKKGQKIAAVGSTGRSTGPHLHFEVKQNRKSINPFTALKRTIKVAIKN